VIKEPSPLLAASWGVENDTSADTRAHVRENIALRASSEDNGWSVGMRLTRKG